MYFSVQVGRNSILSFLILKKVFCRLGKKSHIFTLFWVDSAVIFFNTDNIRFFLLPTTWNNCKFFFTTVKLYLSPCKAVFPKFKMVNYFNLLDKLSLCLKILTPLLRFVLFKEVHHFKYL